MRTTRTILIAALGAALGCGGGASATDEPADEPVASAGDEVIADESAADEEAPPEADEPPPSGPGRLTVHTRVSGANVEGTVQVLGDGDEVVREGASGETFDLPSGTYRVTGAISDASILLDTPTHELDGEATVSPAQTTEVHVDFPAARVRFDVRRAGRPVAQWRMTLTRQGGGDPVEVQPSAEHVAITPGRYDATLRLGAQEIEVSGLILQGGATQTLPVNVN